MNDANETTNDTETDSTDPLIAEAARLFNQWGYATSTVDTIQRELGLESRSEPPYNDGEALARAAFEYAAEASERILDAAVEGEASGIDRLLALILAFRRFVEDPPVDGGSPVFHAAVRSHQAFPFMEERARDIITGWRRRVRRIVRAGIKSGEIRPSARPEHVASIIVGTMEGAIFLHRIYNDTSHLDRSVHYLVRFIDQEVRP